MVLLKLWKHNGKPQPFKTKALVKKYSVWWNNHSFHIQANQINNPLHQEIQI